MPGFSHKPFPKLSQTVKLVLLSLICTWASEAQGALPATSESRVNQWVTGILLRFQIKPLPVLQLERTRRWEKSWGACLLCQSEERLTWGTRHSCGRAGRCQRTVTLLPQQWLRTQLFRSLVHVIWFPQNNGQPYSCFSLLNPRNWGPH